MMCDAGIDLHATNSVVVVLDEENRVLYQKRLRNDLTLILTALAPYRVTLQGVAVESTYNWYWLVDGLMDAGYRPGTDSCLGHRGTRGEVESLRGALPRLDPDWVTGAAQMGADTAADDNRGRLSHTSVWR